MEEMSFEETTRGARLEEWVGHVEETLDITKKKNASWRTSKRQDALNRPVHRVRRERAVLYLGAPRKCRWILCHVPIWPTSTFRAQFF